jgi:hydrogenase maturation protease
MTERPLIIGLGSPHGDDQAGWRVIDRLHARGFPRDRARPARTPAEVWDWCQRADSLTICDACVDGRTTGRIQGWTWPDDRLPMTHGGTHTLSLAEVLALGRELDTLPATVQIWTITGTMFTPNAAPSPAVFAAAETLAERFVRELLDPQISQISQIERHCILGNQHAAHPH